MDATVQAALESFGRSCRMAGIPWQLGGSGLLFSLGLVDAVRDLDVVFPADVMDQLAEVVEESTGSAPSFSARQEDGFVSGFRGQHHWDGVELDMTAGIALDYGTLTVRLPFEPGGLWMVGDEEIPLAPLDQWLLIYRFHNPERAALLDGAVGEPGWADLVARLGLPDGFSGYRA